MASSSTSRNEATDAQTTPSAARQDEPAWRVTPAPSGRGAPRRRVDLNRFAATTPGMVGADLANLANEAALLAARREHEFVAMNDFTDALEKIVLGAARKIVLSHAERERTAHHEAGHAIAGMLLPEADPVRKVSIIPPGMALGVTFAAPAADRFSYDERYLLGKITVALAGRAAEELIYGDITTGAESDIQQLTEMARQMVGRWGMSDAIGPVAVLPTNGHGALLPAMDEVSASSTLRCGGSWRPHTTRCRPFSANTGTS